VEDSAIIGDACDKKWRGSEAGKPYDVKVGGGALEHSTLTKIYAYVTVVTLSIPTIFYRTLNSENGRRKRK